MHIEKIKSNWLPPCDGHDCHNNAIYEIYISIFSIKLCKGCMKKLTSQCNKITN